MDQQDRNVMIEWCALISGDSIKYFERMTNEELLVAYQKKIRNSSDDK